MTARKIELIAGAAAVGFAVTIHVLLDLKLYPGWYVLGIFGYFTVRRSVKRILERRRREDSDGSTLPDILIVIGFVGVLISIVLLGVCT